MNYLLFQDLNNNGSNPKDIRPAQIFMAFDDNTSSRWIPESGNYLNQELKYCFPKMSSDICKQPRHTLNFLDWISCTDSKKCIYGSNIHKSSSAFTRDETDAINTF